MQKNVQINPGVSLTQKSMELNETCLKSLVSSGCKNKLHSMPNGYGVVGWKN
jgi:hypothetical protein